MNTNTYAIVSDIDALNIVSELKHYLEIHNLQFYTITEEFKGKDRYLKFSVSIKMQNKD